MAEIERRRAEIDDVCQGYIADRKMAAEYILLNELLDFLDTLEVKEVDLEKEYEEFVVDDPIFGNFITNDTMGMKLAKHFFELGLKAQKG